MNERLKIAQTCGGSYNTRTVWGCRAAKAAQLASTQARIRPPIQVDGIFVFFFQAEDGIRDKLVTGVQTCALPISIARARASAATAPRGARSAKKSSCVIRSAECAAERRARWSITWFRNRRAATTARDRKSVV